MTGTALDLNHHPATALAIEPGQPTWDKTQLAALAQIGLEDAGEGDRAVFLHVCQRTGLDPFARQIYMIGRNEKVPGTRDQWRKKWTIQTGIDGFRVNRQRAERNAGVRGILGRALFYDHEGKEYRVWVQPRPPVACEITYTVRDRDGGETPYTSVLRFTEYVQTKGRQSHRPVGHQARPHAGEVHRGGRVPQGVPAGLLRHLPRRRHAAGHPARGRDAGRAAARAGHRRRGHGSSPCGGG